MRRVTGSALGLALLALWGCAGSGPPDDEPTVSKRVINYPRALYELAEERGNSSRARVLERQLDVEQRKLRDMKEIRHRKAVQALSVRNYGTGPKNLLEIEDRTLDGEAEGLVAAIRNQRMVVDLIQEQISAYMREAKKHELKVDSILRDPTPFDSTEAETK